MTTNKGFTVNNWFLGKDRLEELRVKYAEDIQELQELEAFYGAIGEHAWYDQIERARDMK